MHKIMQVIRCGRLKRVLRCVVRCTQNHGTDDVEKHAGAFFDHFAGDVQVSSQKHGGCS
jgi:hypothetical protein